MSFLSTFLNFNEFKKYKESINDFPSWEWQLNKLKTSQRHPKSRQCCDRIILQSKTFGLLPLKIGFSTLIFKACIVDYCLQLDPHISQLDDFWHKNSGLHLYLAFRSVPKHHHHHHIALVARISLTLSRHSSLSFIALGRSSGQHPVSSHSC